MADESPVWMSRRKARQKKQFVLLVIAIALVLIVLVGLAVGYKALTSRTVSVQEAQWFEGQWVLPDADKAGNVAKTDASEDTIGGIESIIPKAGVVSYIPVEMKIATTRFVLYYKAASGDVLSEEYRICSQKESNEVLALEGEHVNAGSESLDIFARPTLTLKIRRDGDYHLLANGLTTWSEKETLYKRNR